MSPAKLKIGLEKRGIRCGMLFTWLIIEKENGSPGEHSVQTIRRKEDPKLPKRNRKNDKTRKIKKRERGGAGGGRRVC